MTEFGGILDEPAEPIEDDMVFRLEPLKAFGEEESLKSRPPSGNSGGDPMWASASSSPYDWFMVDE